MGVTFPSLYTVRQHYDGREPPSFIMATGADDDDHIDAGDVPCLARYANHTPTNANAEFVLTDGAVMLVITDDLHPRTEVLVDYGPACSIRTIGGCSGGGH
jgi:hypothetical protein